MSAEEELEKQYRDYKAQFEDWKEKNKNATGTDQYKAYVKQFESWEKDVEKRRRMIREKAEKDIEHERLRQAREEQAREEMERQEREEEARRQAQQYAEEQASYMSHHVAAMEAAERQTVPVSQPAMVAQAMATAATFAPARAGETNPETVMAEMLNIVMGGANAALGGDRPVSQAPPPSTSTSSAPPPQLWGNTRPEYDAKDPLFAKWGLSAAPPHSYIPSTTDQVVTPCWLLLEETQKRKMMLAPSNIPPSIPPSLPPSGPLPTVPLVFMQS